MSSPRVLVVSGEKDVVDSFSMLLKLLGALVRAARSGEEGLAELVDCSPDLVSVDLGMPKMDGFQTTARLRDLPLGRHAIRIAPAGWSDEKAKRCMQEAGFDRHIAEPGNIWELEVLLGDVRRDVERRACQHA